MLTAFIVSGVLFVLLFMATIINFVWMGKNMMDFEEKQFGDGFARHAIFGGLTSLAFLATIVFGIWLAVVS